MTETLSGAPAFPMPRADRCPFDPPPALGGLQQNEPISRVELWDGSTPWLLTRYEDIRAALGDPRVSVDNSLPGYPHATAATAARSKVSRAFINMDDPEHSAQRRLLTSNFMIKKMEALRPRVQRIVDELIDDLLAGPKPADLVAAFALPVPSLVICELLGVPYADRDLFHRISRTIIARDSTPAEAVSATEEMLGYLGDLAEQKNSDPGDDLLSQLVVEQMRTGAMTARQIAGMGQLLLIAGHETTANMIALGTVALLERPDQLAQIRDGDDPALVANAVEELLRYLNIVHAGLRRVALADIEIGGRTIREGEGIVAALSVANRDEAHFPDADDLDVRRKARHHVAFGFGIHQCLGQPLARVELQVVYSTLYRRIPTLALAEPLSDVRFKHDMLVYGVHELPVTW
ncbi:cytochrome P450 [Streptomyces sp. SL13]|uniref:Cytochrome P450 n=1 Tax=Streptantibioticus silvisoli TaxID=2705255 RepID=A0AA90GV70_9ACTN|nr:cytochrome P450 [Streptantibioticus silvisoli]MDI5963262.1 cytochrome P450 [Streptantibioticus silvisoli]MDI5968559.1 cytochrome P450 [Streptantibioticus silvisoli]